MQKDIAEVKKGDPISARKFNELIDRAEKGARRIKDDGSDGGIDNSEFEGRVNRERQILIVRVVSFTVPEHASAYAASNHFNAKVQAWDGDSKQWVDDLSGREVSVIPLLDGVGYIPLEINRQPIPVRYFDSAQAYVPVSWSETAVVVPTSATIADDGTQEGKRLVWNSETKEWVIVDDCYILVIGNG